MKPVRGEPRNDSTPSLHRNVDLCMAPHRFQGSCRHCRSQTTYGSLVHAHNTPAANELCVARTLEAGGVLIGKTTTPEFGFGATCQTRLAGPTANPYDLTRTSGSSSGGSAVAVCTGMTAIAHGTDFGGSCRMPASFTGVVGLRPTAGRIAN